MFPAFLTKRAMCSQSWLSVGYAEPGVMTTGRAPAPASWSIHRAPGDLSVAAPPTPTATTLSPVDAGPSLCAGQRSQGALEITKRGSALRAGLERNQAGKPVNIGANKRRHAEICICRVNFLQDHTLPDVGGHEVISVSVSLSQALESSTLSLCPSFVRLPQPHAPCAAFWGRRLGP